jgi:hypothetical protein
VDVPADTTPTDQEPVSKKPVIISPGTIRDRSAWRTKGNNLQGRSSRASRHFPQDFHSTITRDSYRVPDTQTVYDQRIIASDDTPDAVPTFTVTPRDTPGDVFKGKSPSAPWTEIHKLYQEKLGRKSNSADGPRYFGLPKVGLSIDNPVDDSHATDPDTTDTMPGAPAAVPVIPEEPVEVPGSQTGTPTELTLPSTEAIVANYDKVGAKWKKYLFAVMLVTELREGHVLSPHRLKSRCNEELEGFGLSIDLEGNHGSVDNKLRFEGCFEKVEAGRGKIVLTPLGWSMGADFLHGRNRKLDM